VLLALGVGTHTPARAQQAQHPSADAATAVSLAKEAKGKYDRGEWRGALDLFEAAEKRAHSPVLVLYAARCRRNLGQLVAARQLFNQVASEPLGPNAPAPFTAAKREAVTDLKAISARIPILVIDRAAAPSSWRVSVDGVIAVEDQIAVDPGRRIVRAGSAGTNSFEREIVVEEGAKVTVTIRNGAANATQPSNNTDAPLAGDDVAFAASVGPGLIALGAGTVGVGVGVGLRVVGLNKVSAVKDRCDGNQCLAEDAAEIEEAETLQTVSSVLFAVGAAGIVTGVALMIALPENAPATPVALTLGLGHIGVHGSF